MTTLRVVTVLALLAASSTTASAQKRVDVVTLHNGDRITGEIMSFNRGRLELKTDDAGTIEIEWDTVAGIEAARGFEAETADGRRILGSFQRSADRGVVLVAASDGVISLPMFEVTHHTNWRQLLDQARRLVRCRVHLLAVEWDRADHVELRHHLPATGLLGSAYWSGDIDAQR